MIVAEGAAVRHAAHAIAINKTRLHPPAVGGHPPDSRFPAVRIL